MVGKLVAGIIAASSTNGSFELDEKTSKRLAYAQELATKEKRERMQREFSKAAQQREIEWVQHVTALREKIKLPKEYDKHLSLEQEARLYVLNLGTWQAFQFWRNVKARTKSSASEPLKISSICGG